MTIRINTWKCADCGVYMRKGALAEHQHSVHGKPLVASPKKSKTARASRLTKKRKSASKRSASEVVDNNALVLEWSDQSLERRYGVRGVILTFAAQGGVVLLRHEPPERCDKPSSVYEISENHLGLKVKFHWHVVDDEFKAFLGLPIERVKKKMMIGRLVTCDVVKTDVWHVERLTVDPNGGPMSRRALSVLKRSKTKETKVVGMTTQDKKTKKKRKAIPGLRLQALGFARANLSGRSGGIVLPAAGGRKPGSHRS